MSLLCNHIKGLALDCIVADSELVLLMLSTIEWKSALVITELMLEGHTEEQPS